MSSFDYHESKFTEKEWKEIQKNAIPIEQSVKQAHELFKKIAEDLCSN